MLAGKAEDAEESEEKQRAWLGNLDEASEWSRILQKMEILCSEWMDGRNAGML